MTTRRGPALGIPIAFILWALAFCLSVVLAANTEAVGSGFTRGMNRVGTFFRWQFLSFAIAIASWMITRNNSGLSKAVRLMGRVPITVQCLLGFAGLVVVILAMVFK